jgi:hypothetical protein
MMIRPRLGRLEFLQIKSINIERDRRGTEHQSYNCTRPCNPSSTNGDELKYFEAIRTASHNKKDVSEGGSDKLGQ